MATMLLLINICPWTKSSRWWGFVEIYVNDSYAKSDWPNMHAIMNEWLMNNHWCLDAYLYLLTQICEVLHGQLKSQAIHHGIIDIILLLQYIEFIYIQNTCWVLCIFCGGLALSELYYLHEMDEVCWWNGCIWCVEWIKWTGWMKTIEWIEWLHELGGLRKLKLFVKVNELWIWRV